MPPYIFNLIGNPTIGGIFFNKTRFCSASSFTMSSNKLNGLFVMGGTMITGSVLSYYLYSNMNTNIGVSWSRLHNTMSGFIRWSGLYKSVNNESVIRDESYENKYYDQYEQLELCELEEDYVKSLRNNVVFETTPKGGIVMYYDFEKESFIYYCDTKDISYLYLETVARKYAMTFHCKKLVVDMKHELILAKEKKNNVNKNDEKIRNTDTKDASNDNLFATFKSYNKKGLRVDDDGNVNLNKKFVLRRQANRYSYGGKIGQFSILKPDEYKIEKPTDNMNYETFKKLMAKKN